MKDANYNLIYFIVYGFFFSLKITLEFILRDKSEIYDLICLKLIDISKLFYTENNY